MVTLRPLCHKAAKLTSYLRSGFSTKPAWSHIPAQLREARDGRVGANLS